jgi:hypothetical protein
VLAHRSQSLTRDFQQPRVTMQQEIRVGLMFKATDTPAQLI